MVLNDNMDEGQGDLFLAIKNFDYPAVKQIIEQHQRNPRLASIDLNEALLTAVKLCHVKIVRLLLLQPSVRVTYQDEHRRSAIHYAADTSTFPVLYLLIRAGSSLNQTDKDGMTPLHYASRSGHVELMNLLIKNGARVNGSMSSYDSGNVESPLHYAAKSGKILAVGILLHHGVDVNQETKKDKMIPLHKAVIGRHDEAVKFLVSAGANINKQDSQGRTPLHMAIGSKMQDVCHFLLMKGANPRLQDHKGNNALHTSIYYSQEQTTDLLLNIDQSLVSLQDDRGCTALHCAALVGLADDAVRLLNAGAAIDLPDGHHGNTPLSISIAHNKLEFARVLVYSGAAVDVTDAEGTTPLHKIISSRLPDKCDLAELLLEYNATVNPVTRHGYSPLDRCVFQCMLNNFDRQMLHLLVVNGAHLYPVVAVKSLTRNSPLCWLVWKGDLKSARFLVEVGWDIKKETWLDLPGKNEEQNAFLIRLQELSKTPQHLTNLCRSAVRRYLNILMNDHEIVTSIKRLPLPNMLKRFLLFHDESNELLKEEK